MQIIKKGDRSITEYLQEIKDIVDTIQSVSAPLSDINIVYHTLRGLPVVFDSFCTSIHIHEQPIKANSLHNILLSEEINILSISVEEIHLEANSHAFSIVRGASFNNYNRRAHGNF